MAEDQNIDTGGMDDLASRMEGLLDAENSSPYEQGSFPSAPPEQRELPQQFPQLERIAMAAEQLESIMGERTQMASENPLASPALPPRAESAMPGPTGMPGFPNIHSAWVGGAGYGLAEEVALPRPREPEALMPELPQAAPAAAPAATMSEFPAELFPAAPQAQLPELPAVT